GYADIVLNALLAHRDVRFDRDLDAFAGQDPELLRHLAAALERAHRDDEAALVARRLLEVHAGDADARRLLARYHLERHRPAEALPPAGGRAAGRAPNLWGPRALAPRDGPAEAAALLRRAPWERPTAAVAFAVAERAIGRRQSAEALAALDRLDEHGLAPAE